MTLFPLCLFQDHYDFGMRAVKTVISTAGNLKRENPDMDEVNVFVLHTAIFLRGLFCILIWEERSPKSWVLKSLQELICLRAIRDANVPKFLQDDLKLFNGIVSDLFPNIRETPVDYGILEEAIRKSCIQANLKDVDGEGKSSPQAPSEPGLLAQHAALGKRRVPRPTLHHLLVQVLWLSASSCTRPPWFVTAWCWWDQQVLGRQRYGWDSLLASANHHLPSDAEG